MASDMAEHHLSNDEFFAQLAALFDANRNKGHGSIYLTQKRLIHGTDADAPSKDQQEKDPLWDTHPEHPLPIIIRATDSKSTKRKGTDREDKPKTKLSTIVQSDELGAFYVRYADVCKGGMTSLKKRDRSKRKKDKAKKKKTGEGETKG